MTAIRHATTLREPSRASQANQELQPSLDASPLLLLPPEALALVLLQSASERDAYRASLTCKTLFNLTKALHIKEKLNQSLTEKLFTAYAQNSKFSFSYHHDIIRCLRKLSAPDTVVYLETDSREFKLAKTALMMQQLYEVMLRLSRNDMAEFTIQKSVTEHIYFPGMYQGTYRKCTFMKTFPLEASDCFNFNFKLKNITSLLTNPSASIVFNDELTKLLECLDLLKESHKMRGFVATLVNNLFSASQTLTAKDKIYAMATCCVEKLILASTMLNEYLDVAANNDAAPLRLGH
jgi:hypothetical protein